MTDQLPTPGMPAHGAVMTDNPVMTGGLPDMSMPQTPQAQVPTQTTETPPVTTQEKYVIGSKTFNSADAALAYANGLSEARANVGLALSNYQPVQTPQNPTPNKKLADLVFENPEEAVAQITRQVEENVNRKQNEIETNRNFWNSFYQSNPDLVGKSLVVDAVHDSLKKNGSYNNLSLGEASPVLAAKAREEFRKMTGNAQAGNALPSGPAMVAGASGASSPKVTPPAAKPTTFIDELRMARQRA